MWTYGSIATTVLALCISPFSNARAESLAGAELEAYDAYCPEGNYRAVWAEPLTGIQSGWVNLVCLNEDEQKTSYWYVTPEGDAVSPDEAEIPVYVLPFVQPDALERITAAAEDDSIRLWLDFRYEQPNVPSIEAFGAPAGVAGFSSSSAGGRGDQPVNTYELNGQPVTQAEYQAWETSFITASRAQDAERDRLVRQQVRLALYDLVERNQWHDLIDVDAVNNGTSTDTFWEYRSTLVTTLTGKQARQLLQTSEDLVYVSLYLESMDEDSITTTAGGQGVIPGTNGSPTINGSIETIDQPPADDDKLLVNETGDSETGSSETGATEDQTSESSAPGKSAGGTLHPLALLLLALIRSRARRK